MTDIFSFSISETKYPKLLKEIADPPELLYVRGRGSKINLEKTIGVVGSREISPYGRMMTATLVSDLVKNGFTIVSGLALGVDTIAHETAIAAAGKTIAVLGCGIDIIYPTRNALLYQSIVNGNGAIVSEFGPGIKTDVARFKTRNRIISGLSLGVLVIEGSERSGSLITAKYALEQGRDVFAVPGEVTNKNSRATSILLKNGAKLVESASDIIEEL